MRRSLARAVSGVGLLLVVLGMVLIGLTSARAHSWYPYQCCSSADCHPASTGDADAREPDPVRVPGGWRLHDGTVIADADAKPSPDGRFHVCRYGGHPRAAVIHTDGNPCFWAPAPSI